MNSDKAAAVRDSVNGTPDVVGEEQLIERDGEPFDAAGRDGLLTGDRVKPEATQFRPAYIEQVGTFGDGTGAERPVFVVVLESLWTDTTDARSLSAELVYEVAKHDCGIRFYPPDHRLDGDVWIVDHFSEDLSHNDGQRCECGSTYFKLRDGVATCAKCGTPAEQHQEETHEVTMEHFMED